MAGVLLRQLFTRISTALPTAREQLRGQLGLTENPGVADDIPSILIKETAGTYTWKALSVAGHTHTNPGIEVKSNNVQVDPNITSVDFSSAFTVSESPEDEANIAPNFGTSSGTIAQGNHTHSTTYAPIAAKYLTQTADSDLTNEQALSSLSTGLMKVTTGTGVVSTAVSGTDYSAPVVTKYQGASQESSTANLDFTSWQHTVTGASGTATVTERWWHPMQGHFKQDLAIPGGTTFQGVGQTALTVDAGATNTNQDATDGPWVRSVTGSVSGNTGGFTGHSSGNVRYDWAPSSVFVVKTDATTTSIRVWVGWFASDPSGSDNPSGVTGMGFRYSTGTGDTNWMYWTNDATTTGTATSTGVAYTGGNVFRLGIHVDPVSGDIRFYLSTTGNPETAWTLGGTVASGAGDFPVSSTSLTRYARVTTLTNAGRRLELSRITHYHER